MPRGHINPDIGPLSMRLPFVESPPLGKMLSPPGMRLIARRIAMPAVEFSRAARDVLLRRVAGERVQVAPENVEAYRELARSGLMEPTSGLKREPESWFRFTREGYRVSGALAAAEHLPHLSDQALRLLQSHLAAIGLGNGGATGYPTDATRKAYHELAKAGLMMACHSFSRGPDSVYRPTEEAYRRREELRAIQRPRFKPSAWRRASAGV